MTSVELQGELALLRIMNTGELRAKYLEVFGEASPSRHKERLVRRIAWKIQALAEGDLSERARRRAEEIANDADLRIRVPIVTWDTAITLSLYINDVNGQDYNWACSWPYYSGTTAQSTSPLSRLQSSSRLIPVE